jgi:membrane protein DedA with SNARE-associated domain
MDSNTGVRNLGIGLTVIGILVLVGYTFYNILTIESNMILKISLAAIILGILLALLSLIKEKMETNDAEVERKY